VAKFILRVDDCGWVPPSKANDRGLEYFQRWRNAFGIAGHPVYYGFIPTTIGPPEIDWLRRNLSPAEKLTVHGWNHARGAEVEAFRMQQALTDWQLPEMRQAYIPPFNAYTRKTIEDWGATSPEGYFFGGFHREHHTYGNLPVFLPQYDVWHIPAPRELYDRAPEILKNLDAYRQYDCPLTVTLHATWDAENLPALRELLTALEPDLVPADTLYNWQRAAELNRHQLTGPHFYAYSWICEHVQLADKILDFGSRYSELPSQMALRGGLVTAVDRDTASLQRQHQIAKKYGVSSLSVVTWDGTTAPPAADYHRVTSCWALQHNLAEGAIEGIVKNMAAALRPNGTLLLVGSFSPDLSVCDRTREDPQWILNWEDYERRVIAPSGLQLETCEFFKYRHRSPDAAECEQAAANAVCLELRKVG